MKYIWFFIKVIIQCTWGSVQSIAGLIVFFINIKKPHCFYRGNIVTKWNTLSGLSLGLFMFTPNENISELRQYADGTQQGLVEYANRITVHEYGHTIQSLILGPFMLIPGITSLVWGRMKKYEDLRVKYGVPYTFCWAESWASKLGEKYTGNPAVW